MKRIKNSPPMLMILGSVSGALWFEWIGGIIGGIVGFILDITLGYKGD